jgi:hypothetical protein
MTPPGQRPAADESRPSAAEARLEQHVDERDWPDTAHPPANINGELDTFVSWFADWWLRRGRYSATNDSDKT